MRLYLSSYKFGDHPEELLRLVGANKRAVVIMNAVDFGDKKRKNESAQKQMKQLVELGFSIRELDLRDYFKKQDQLKELLLEIDLVWIHGGNAFILQRAFQQSGFGEIIRDFVKKDKIVYAGFSAAVCVIAPTLHGVDLVDDPNIIPKRYKKEFDWNGLGLINYNVAVHYRSDHKESEDVEKEVSYYQSNNIPYKTLRDGEAIIINGGEEIFLK